VEPEMTSPLIEVSRYSFSLGGKKILREISLVVTKGEYLSIIGPNGSGKTTLLRCLDRIYRGGEGSIRIGGRPLASLRQRELARRVSYVPQVEGRNFPFTVIEFVRMGRYPYLSPFSSLSERDEEAVRDALDRTGTAELAHRFLRTLSGGECQKVFIAAALAQGAEVILLDEPTTFLDPRHEADIHRLLARANRDRGVTIITATHDINSAVLWSRRILALKNGAVHFCGSPEEVMDKEILQGIYETSFLLVKHPRTGTFIVAPEMA